MEESPEPIVTRGGAVEFQATGLRHPRSTLLGGRCFTAYQDVTHLALGSLGVRLASCDGVFLLRRSAFREPDGPERMARTLVSRIASSPGGAAHIERMLTLDRRSLAPVRPWVTRGTLALCLVGYALQVFYGEQTDLAAMFSAPLVSMGELWRLVTANFLHGSPLHLLLNVGCLAVLGGLAERCLGSAAVALVVALSGAGAMLGSWAAGYAWAVGASGIVAGLAGSLLWLEFRRPGEIPAGWRIPRRIFVGVIVVETAVLAFVPAVAHAAHAGGLLAGAAAAALVAPPPARRPWLVPTNALLGLALLASTASATRAALDPSPEAVEQRAYALLALDLSPQVWNNEAWRIAISNEPEARELAAALLLAERAVEETGRADPNVLDTLAEIHFAAGDNQAAIAVIDEAIAWLPDESYFREQRRRFTGERAAGDRPGPPGFLPLPEQSPSPAPEDPGIRL